MRDGGSGTRLIVMCGAALVRLAGLWRCETTTYHHAKTGRWAGYYRVESPAFALVCKVFPMIFFRALIPVRGDWRLQ